MARSLNEPPVPPIETSQELTQDKETEINERGRSGLKDVEIGRIVCHDLHENERLCNSGESDYIVVINYHRNVIEKVYKNIFL